MVSAADYARAVAFLDRARMPAYVSFVEHASARGMGNGDETPHRIYVRIADGKIVGGVPPANSHAVQTGNGDSDNPFRNNGFFDPRCYVPTSEGKARWNGQPALRFELHATCNQDTGITELYADPISLRPIAVDGDMPDKQNPGMTTAIEMRYETVGGYTVPSSIRAHAVGHGWLFLARERVQVDYGDYEFYSPAEFARRQASKPSSHRENRPR
jgi:hypothetical protein